MKNGLMSRIGAGLSGLAMLATVGCTSLNPKVSDFSDIRYIAQVLGLKEDSSQIASLHNGYYATEDGAMDVRIIAGIRAGTIKAVKTKNGYYAEGRTLNQMLYPQVFDETCADIDENADKILTNKEILDAKERVYGGLK